MKTIQPVVKLARNVVAFSPDVEDMTAQLLEEGVNSPDRHGPPYHAALLVLHHASELRRHAQRLIENVEPT